MIRNHQKLLRIVLSVFNDKSNGLKQKSWDKNGRYFCPPLSSARLNLAQQDWWENHTGDYRCRAHARVLQTSFRECVTVSSEAAAKGVIIQVLKRKPPEVTGSARLPQRLKRWFRDLNLLVLMATSSTCVVYIWLEMWWKGGMCFPPAVREEKPGLVYSAWNLSIILHAWLWWFLRIRKNMLTRMQRNSLWVTKWIGLKMNWSTLTKQMSKLLLYTLTFKSLGSGRFKKWVILISKMHSIDQKWQ